MALSQGNIKLKNHNLLEQEEKISKNLPKLQKVKIKMWLSIIVDKLVQILKN